MRTGRWLLMIFAVCFAVVAMIPGVGAASTLSGFHKIMEIRDYPVGDEVSPSSLGDVNGVYFTLNGKSLCLVPDFMYFRGGHIESGSVHFMSGDRNQTYLSFPVEKFPRFHVYKFQNDAGQEFLLILSDVMAVTNSATKGLWLVGGYGSQYVTFATFDSVCNAGLIGEHFMPSIENGELRLLGVARYAYNGFFQGHRAFEYDRYDHCYYINWVSLFWNSDAQWFGIRHAN